MATKRETTEVASEGVSEETKGDTPDQDKKDDGWGATKSVVVEVPVKSHRGQRYTEEEKAVKLKKIEDLIALGQRSQDACKAAGISYVTWRNWVNATPKKESRRETSAEYVIPLDVRELVANNRATVVEALIASKSEPIKTTILALLGVTTSQSSQAQPSSSPKSVGGSETSPYPIVLDARELIAANRDAVVAALMIGTHESTKTAVGAVLNLP